MFRSLITLFLFFVLCSVQGQTPTYTYTTTTATNSEPLDWDDAASWVGGVVPVLTGGTGAHHVININHDLTKTGNKTVSHTSFNIAANKTFTIDGNFTDSFEAGDHGSATGSVFIVTGDFILTSSSNFHTGLGTVTVGGDFTASGGSTTTVEGSLTVAGNMVFIAGADLDVLGSGIANVGMDLTVSGNHATVDGSLNVTGHIGLVFGGYINGDGYVHWGTASVGSGYIGSCYVAAWDAPPIPSNSGVHLIDCSESLPVELLSFSSDCTKEGVLIDWGTATETDNDFFEIQKAVGSFDFVTIGEVDGGGTSKTLSSYSYLDNRLVTGLTVYYRLRQVDFDGEYEYSKVIVSNCEALDKGFSIYPTVSSGEYTLTFNNKTEFIQIQLINELGQIMKVVNHTNTDGSSELKFELNGFSSGVYYAKVLLHNQYEVAKLIKR